MRNGDFFRAPPSPLNTLLFIYRPLQKMIPSPHHNQFLNRNHKKLFFDTQYHVLHRGTNVIQLTGWYLIKSRTPSHKKSHCCFSNLLVIPGKGKRERKYVGKLFIYLFISYTYIQWLFNPWPHSPPKMELCCKLDKVLLFNFIIKLVILSNLEHKTPTFCRVWKRSW